MNLTKVKDGGFRFHNDDPTLGGCAFSAIANQQLNGYDAHWGQLFVWDKNSYTFHYQFSNFHMWNTDENGVIVDDTINLNESLKRNSFNNDRVEDWNVLVINKEDLDYQITDMMSYEQSRKRMKKLYRNSKYKVDAIYIKGLAYDSMKAGDFSKPINQEYVDTEITASVMNELQFS